MHVELGQNPNDMLVLAINKITKVYNILRYLSNFYQ